MYAARKNRVPGRFEVEVVVHTVTKLITEDYAPALEFTYDKHAEIYLPSTTRGAIIHVDAGLARKVEAVSAFRLYLDYFVEGVRNAFENHPGYELNSVVWGKNPDFRSSSWAD